MIDTGLMEDVAKYRKKKESNISSSAKKSNHKHKYKKVLLKTITTIRGKDEPHYSIGRVCEICGKHRIENYFVTARQEDGTFLLLDQSKVLEMYSYLDIVDIGREW